jgi:hypothetical protein
VFSVIDYFFNLSLVFSYLIDDFQMIDLISAAGTHKIVKNKLK